MTPEELRSRSVHPLQLIVDIHNDGNQTQQTHLPFPTEELPLQSPPDDSHDLEPPSEATLSPNSPTSTTNSTSETTGTTTHPSANQPRCSDRIRRFPKHLHDFAAHVQLQTQNLTSEDLTDNLTFKQAHLNPKWRTAMQEEIDSIHNNRTWSLVPLPLDKKAITSRWVFKLKTGINGDPTRFKARLVARGFEQTNGVDFVDTFAPVVRWETIRTLIAIAVHLNWPIHQLDVLTTFLNGILKEDVYMLQPPGFVKPGTEHLVCKLHKSLYGLKQSP